MSAVALTCHQCGLVLSRYKMHWVTTDTFKKTPSRCKSCAVFVTLENIQTVWDYILSIDIMASDFNEALNTVSGTLLEAT